MSQYLDNHVYTIEQSCNGLIVVWEIFLNVEFPGSLIKTVTLNHSFFQM